MEYDSFVVLYHRLAVNVPEICGLLVLLKLRTWIIALEQYNLQIPLSGYNRLKSQYKLDHSPIYNIQKILGL